MTPLEQKAIDYVYSILPSNQNIDIEQYRGENDGYIAGYTEALRWRDVNIELPEVGIDVFAKDEYNGNLGKPVYWVSWINKRGYFTMLQTFGNDYTNKPTHWRPIETI